MPLFFHPVHLPHDLHRLPLHRIGRVEINPVRHLEALMPQAALDFLEVHAVFAQFGGVGMPLRYNYDKPEKPRISRVFGYQARFFILFHPEKSSREVVIS